MCICILDVTVKGRSGISHKAWIERKWVSKDQDAFDLLSEYKVSLQDYVA